MFHFPQRASSRSHIPWCYLYLPSHSTLSSRSQSWGDTKYTEGETHTDTPKLKNTYREERRKHIQKTNAFSASHTHTHTHTYTHTHIYIYRHSGPYFRMLSAGGQRLEETQDEFSPASFHHTAMTPLFTSPIYLRTDCLPTCLACVCACVAARACCVGVSAQVHVCEAKCISTFTVMK